jgi:vacuolar protein sorting-associated protein 33A
MSCTCMCSGLIDEMFGIQQSSVRLPAEKFSQQQTQQQKLSSGSEQQSDTKQIIFSSAEELYAEIRGLNFNAVGPTLSRKASFVFTVPVPDLKL